MTRTDTHRPSVIDPSEYEISLYFDFGGDEEPAYGIEEAHRLYSAHGAKVHAGLSNCDICGANYRYGALFWHEPSKTYISTGEDCAHKLQLAFNSHEFKNMRVRAKRHREQLKSRIARRKALRRFVEEHRGSDLLRALRCKDRLVQNLREEFVRWAEWRDGGLTAKQQALVLDVWRKSQEPEPVRVPVPVDDERIDLEGVVIAEKTTESSFGLQRKMLLQVETPEGSWLCWGTVSRALGHALWDENRRRMDAWRQEEPEGKRPPEAVLRGSTVQFSAVVTRGDREPHFGFFSRPTKPLVLSFGEEVKQCSRS